MNGLFFTGTDTGVGKTHVAAGVAHLLRRQGQAVRVAKPVATGAPWVQDRWISEDTQRLAEAAGTEDVESITPWTYPEPVAPPVAARLHGVELRLEELVAAIRRPGRADEFLLVEGVGGLLCPLTEHETVADLAVALGLPLVVVARNALGTLNHTLLTLEAAAARNLRVAGLVVNEPERKEDLAARTNVEELRRRIAVPLLAVVGHNDWKTLDTVDWRQLAAFHDDCR